MGVCMFGAEICYLDTRKYPKCSRTVPTHAARMKGAADTCEYRAQIRLLGSIEGIKDFLSALTDLPPLYDVRHEAFSRSKALYNSQDIPLLQIVVYDILLQAHSFRCRGCGNLRYNVFV